MLTNTVDQIREHLSRNSGVNEETMLPLARNYALEVQQANSRLQACTNLLHRGLRSEALQQANIRPNLIDLCARLDFPEFDEWLEILQFLGIELPQTLNRDAVQQVQEAMVDEQPLEDLLRQHRRLAIGKAPLAWRLRVLRNIAKLDTSSTVWVEDIEVWERARVKEMKQQLDAARASRDLPTCAMIDQELKSPNWVSRPPKELTQQVKELRDRFEFDYQVGELQKLAKSLNDAFCEGNQAKAQGVRASWELIVANLKKPVPSNIQEDAEPALVWLANRDQEAADEATHLHWVEQLDQVLKSSRSLLEVERAYHAATRGDFALDPIIEKRYQALCGELQIAGRRKQWVIISAVLATCTVLIVALVLWQSERMRANDVRLAGESLRKMLDENRIEDAQAFVSQIGSSKPHVAQQADFTSLVSELSGKTTAEKERAQAFANYLAEADTEDAAKIDRAAINRAEKLARTDADKSAVFRVKSRRDQWEQEAQRVDFQALRAALEPIKSSIERNDKLPMDSLNENELQDILKSLMALTSKYVHAGSDGRELVETYKTKVSSLLASHQKLMSARTREASRLDRIRAAQSLGELKTSLQECVNELPNSRYSNDFKRVVAESNRWAVADRWNELSLESEKLLAKFDPAKPSALAIKFDLVAESLNGHLLGRMPSIIRQSLDRAALRESKVDELITNLEGSLLGNLVSVEAPLKKGDKAQRFFAFAEHIKRQETVIARMSDEAARSNKFEVVADAEGTVESRTLYPPLSIKPQPKRYVSELVDHLKSNRERILNAWDSEFLIQMGKVVQASEVDPGQRRILVGLMLKAATEGSTFLDQKLKISTRYLEHQLTEPADWFHPKPASEKYEITDELRRMVFEPLRNVYLERDSADAELRQLAKARLNWIGVLLKDGDVSSMHLRSGAVDGELIVFAQVDPEEPMQSVLIGQLEKGNANLKKGEPAIVSGRPVFLLPKS